MNINHLRIFCEVYKTGSTTKAAENLYLTQPAVSRAIKEIEQEYSIRLFQRFHKRLVPTAFSREIYEKGMRILSAYRELDNDLKNAESRQTIVLGATVTVGNFLIPKVCTAFQHQYPEVTIQVHVSNGASLIEMLRQNTVDIAVIEDAFNDPDILTEKIGESRLTAVCGKNSSLKPEMRLAEIQKEPLLLREKGSAARHFVDELFSRYNLQTDPLWESTSFQALLRAASENLGIAFVPEQLAEEFVNEAKVRKIKITESDMCRSVMLCYHVDKYFTDSLNAFRNYLRDSKPFV